MSRLDFWLAHRTDPFEPCVAEPFHDAWLAHAGDPPMVRLAHAIAAQWLGARLVVEPEEPIVGRLALEAVVTWRFDGTVSLNQALWQAHYAQADAAGRCYLDELRATWRGRTGVELAASVRTPTERALPGGHFWIPFGCHSSPFHTRLAAEGIEGLRQRVFASRAANLDQPGTEPAEWYDALLILLDGIARFPLCYAQAVRAELTRGDLTPARRQELEGIAARCERVFRLPASSFHDALQAYWFSRLLHAIDSPGRFDQDLGPWLDGDLAQGATTREQAQELVDCVWAKFAKHRAWSLTLGGQTPEGSDATNTLTWMVLDAMRRARTDAPSVSLRVHRGTPPALLREASALLAAGYSMPALVNDEPAIANLTAQGVALEHARDYTLVGCTQVVVRGRSGGSFEDVIVNLATALELALHNGCDPRSGLRLGPATGAPETFASYDAFERACFTQIEHLLYTTTEAFNRELVTCAQHYPDFWKSLTIVGCLEKGVDYRHGGALYPQGLVDALGITNIGDSLLAIRRLVYDEHRLTLGALVSLLDADWAGQEPLRQEVLNRLPKFGNGDEVTDEYTRRVFVLVNETLQARERAYGGRFALDVVGWTGSVEMGAKTGATPDGRRAGAPLCDSVGPSQGRDRSGVTAVLRSVARLPHDRAHGSLALNLRFAAQALAGPEGPERLLGLVDAAFGLGLQQLQINVVSADTMRAAQANPQAYESLVVRIGGFSTYFNWLAKEHQNDLIARTEHMM